MAISTAPSRKVASEKHIEAIISKGGKTTVESKTSTDATKSIKLVMTAEEMEMIKELRAMRKAPRGRKIAISVHDWVIEAVQEKIERENRKYDRL